MARETWAAPPRDALHDADAWTLATPWWRRVLRLGPDQTTVAAHDRQRKLQAAFGGPLTIVVASPKGGAGKTPTARGVAAAFADARGGGVVAFDNNELRGTLLTRSVPSHSGHVGDLLASSAWFTRPEATALELERTMHRQPDSHEWVLGADPGSTTPMTHLEFAEIHQILTKYFPVLVVDTGNNELATNWRAAVAVADLLVVPMKWRSDHVQPAVAMLDAMSARGDRIEGRTVIVGTNGRNEVDPAARSEAMKAFTGLPVIEIPTDHTLHRPTIQWSALNPSTRTAYQALGAKLSDLALTLGQ